jgi:hypothetical protein
VVNVTTITSNAPAHTSSNTRNVREPFLFSLTVILLNGDHGKQFKFALLE